MTLDHFNDFRQRMLGLHAPRHRRGTIRVYDLIVWLQGSWETALGAAVVAEMDAFNEGSVLVMGSDTRAAAVRAPTTREMQRLLPGTTVGLFRCENTKEQAQAFWRNVKTRHQVENVLVVCAHWHVPRAALTFEGWRDVSGVQLYWKASTPAVREKDIEELAKIKEYSARGDCLPLPELRPPL